MQKRSFLPVIAEEHFQKLPVSFPLGFLEAKLLESSTNYLHLHNFVEIGICIEGSGIFIFSDKIVPFSKGDVTVFPPGMPHNANSSPGLTSKWIFIFFDPSKLLSSVCDRPEILSLLGIKAHDFPHLFKAKKNPEISSLIKKAVKAYEEKPFWFETQIRALVLLVLIEMQRCSAPLKGKFAEEFKQDFSAIGRISPALNHISGNYMNRILVQKLAKICGVSVETLRRLFKKAVEKSPENYLQHMRVQIAASLLENTSLQIGEISAKTGFQTLSCFNRQFRKIMNKSPRRWRMENT